MIAAPRRGGSRRGAADRYRRRLAAERDEAAVYRALAERRGGEEREILLALALAEERHADHWADLLAAELRGDGAGEADAGKADEADADGDADEADADDAGPEHGTRRTPQDMAGAEDHRPGLRARLLAWLARRVGTMLVLGMVQRAEVQRGAGADTDATEAMAADELVHARVVAGLAHARRASASGVLRAAVFGVNDGLVSNLSLVLGIGAAGAGREVLLLTGLAGLLAGALSMAAGEYVSIRTQRELLDGGGPSRLDTTALLALRHGDANELALVFRAEGVPVDEADRIAARLLAEVAAGTPPSRVDLRAGTGQRDDPGGSGLDVVGSAARAAVSSFLAFAAGAVVPVLPFLVGGGAAAIVWAAVTSGAVLFAIGCLLGVYAGGPVVRRGARQLGIGAAAALVTYALGTVFGVAVS